MNLAFTIPATTKHKAIFIQRHRRIAPFDSSYSVPTIEKVISVSPIQTLSIEDEIKKIEMEKQIIIEKGENIAISRKSYYSMMELMNLPKSQCSSCRK